MKEKNEYYHHAPEKWNADKCRKVSRKTVRDGLGTPYPFKGYIGQTSGMSLAYGTTRYNGGCIRGGKWYIGEVRPLPYLADGFEIVTVPTWGERIIEKGQG